MKHKRCFTHASSEQLLAVILGLRFCGEGGLMARSTAHSEDAFDDGYRRFIKGFKPLGDSLGSMMAGSWDVQQEIIEYQEGPHGVAASIRMSFSPGNPKDQEPSGSFLWQIEPCVCGARTDSVCWTEFINTQETRGKQIPDLRVKRCAKWVFQLGHNRLIQKAAERAADILNGNDRGVVFAGYAQESRLNFRLDRNKLPNRPKPANQSQFPPPR
jgi:hypothetical protein